MKKKTAEMLNRMTQKENEEISCDKIENQSIYEKENQDRFDFTNTKVENIKKSSAQPKKFYGIRSNYTKNT
eukprot:UN00899